MLLYVIKYLWGRGWFLRQHPLLPEWLLWLKEESRRLRRRSVRFVIAFLITRIPNRIVVFASSFSKLSYLLPFGGSELVNCFPPTPAYLASTGKK